MFRTRSIQLERSPSWKEKSFSVKRVRVDDGREFKGTPMEQDATRSGHKGGKAKHWKKSPKKIYNSNQ